MNVWPCEDEEEQTICRVGTKLGGIEISQGRSLSTFDWLQESRRYPLRFKFNLVLRHCVLKESYEFSVLFDCHQFPDQKLIL